jgi:TatA/E family protein of Tat protein translocase
LNFLGMGPMELVLIMVLALIVFGPGKLPEIAGQIGKMVRDFRSATSEMSTEFNKAFTLEAEQAKAPAPPTQPPQPTLPSTASQSDAAVSVTSTGSADAMESPRIAPPSSVAAQRVNDLQPPY